MIKNKLKIGLLSFTLLSVLFLGSAKLVKADNLTYTSDVTVTVGSYDYIIKGDPDGPSTATSVVINSADLTVTIPSGSTFTLTSADRKVLGTDQSSGFSFSCAVSLSTLILHQTTGSPVTFVIAPTDTCTPILNGGGGGNGSSSGGGSSSADTTPPTATSVSISAGAATTSSLSTTLTLAATGATQMLISNDSGFAGASWETYATSKSWTLTTGDGIKTVYAKFRDAALNVSATVSDTISVSGSGTVAVAPTPPAPTEGCSGGNLYNTANGNPCVNNVGNVNQNASVHSGPYNFGTQVLKNGSKGEAVKELQRFLNKVLNLGLVIDGKLGPKTIKVIKQWQKDNDLTADGLIGSKTKVKMNASVQ
jgi:hypothetical protein